VSKVIILSLAYLKRAFQDLPKILENGSLEISRVSGEVMAFHKPEILGQSGFWQKHPLSL
jgi:hypothetical protein